jgi:hypothetical protein
MKPGDVYKWLDQGPVLLLESVLIYDPITIEELGSGIINEDWHSELGWTVKVLTTGEFVDVHEDTLREIE